MCDIEEGDFAEYLRYLEAAEVAQSVRRRATAPVRLAEGSAVAVPVSA